MSNVVKCLRHYGLVGTLRRLMHMKGDVKVGRLVGVDQVRHVSWAKHLGVCRVTSICSHCVLFLAVQLGNHFYEDNTQQFGRHRWVEYAGLPWNSDVEPTAIGADWHGWLHNMTDLTGDNFLLKEPGHVTVSIVSVATSACTTLRQFLTWDCVLFG